MKTNLVSRVAARNAEWLLDDLESLLNQIRFAGVEKSAAQIALAQELLGSIASEAHTAQQYAGIPDVSSLPKQGLGRVGVIPAHSVPFLNLLNGGHA